jgi:hypothetical protein
MSEVTGIIEAVGTKEVKTRFGMKPTYSFKVDGEWYKTGFAKPPAGKGDTVSFAYTEGTYGKEVDAKTMSVPKDAPSIDRGGAATPASPRPAPSYGGKGVFPIPALDGQRAIVRQNALTNARELVVAASGGKPFPISDETTNAIIAFARQFEAYACGDLDAVRARELSGGIKAIHPTTTDPTAGMFEEVTK